MDGKGGHYQVCKLKGRMDKGVHYDVEMKGYYDMMCKLKGAHGKGDVQIKRCMAL